MSLTTLDYMRLLVDLLMLSTGIGLLVVALSTPRRNATNYYFAIFAFVLSAFALVLLLRTATNGIPNLSPHFVLRLLALFLVLLISAFYSFVIYFLGNYRSWIKWLTWGLWLFAMIASGLIMFTNIFAEIYDDGTRFRLNWIGLALIAIAIIYSICTVLIVWRSTASRSRWLRIPSLSIAIGYSATALVPDMPLDVFLFTLGALWSASALMRQQIFVP